jgi:hypothetical protein
MSIQRYATSTGSTTLYRTGAGSFTAVSETNPEEGSRNVDAYYDAVEAARVARARGQPNADQMWQTAYRMGRDLSGPPEMQIVPGSVHRTLDGQVHAVDGTGVDTRLVNWE